MTYRSNVEERIGETVKVMESFGRFKPGTLLGHNRLRKNVEARIAVAKYVRDKWGYSLSTIGFNMNRNHTSILHYLRRHDELHITSKNGNSLHVHYVDLYLEFSSIMETACEDIDICHCCGSYYSAP